jgi:hypothetical protein
MVDDERMFVELDCHVDSDSSVCNPSLADSHTPQFQFQSRQAHNYLIAKKKANLARNTRGVLGATASRYLAAASRE